MKARLLGNSKRKAPVEPPFSEAGLAIVIKNSKHQGEVPDAFLVMKN